MAERTLDAGEADLGVDLLPGHASAALADAQLARGLAALGAGAYGDAYHQLRRMFDRADPAHHPMKSCWAIGDLAEAALHSGHEDAGMASGVA